MFVTCTVGAFFMPLKIRGSTASQARNKGGKFVKSTPELDKENVNPQRHRPRNSVPLSVRSSVRYGMLPQTFPHRPCELALSEHFFKH